MGDHPRHLAQCVVDAADPAHIVHPDAPWVPWLLDAHRPHRVDVAAGWDVLRGSCDLRLDARGSWASPVAGADGRWWLDAPVAGRLGGLLAVPVSRGELALDVGGILAMNYAGASALPLEALVLAPGLAPGAAPPLRIEIGLRYGR